MHVSRFSCQVICRLAQACLPVAHHAVHRVRAAGIMNRDLAAIQCCMHDYWYSQFTMFVAIITKQFSIPQVIQSIIMINAIFLLCTEKRMYILPQ